MSSIATIASMDMPGALEVPTAKAAFGIMGIAFVLFGILFVAVVGFIIFSAVRRYRAAKEAGLDPFAGDIQLMGAAKDSAMLAPERSMAERLAEVDALRAAGTISEDEHSAARARIIGSI